MLMRFAIERGMVGRHAANRKCLAQSGREELETRTLRGNLSDRFANFPLNPLRMLMSKTEMAEGEELGSNLLEQPQGLGQFRTNPL